MKKISLFEEDESQALEEIMQMDKLLEDTSQFEAMEEQEEYTSYLIVSFTFEDGTIPKRDGSLGSLEDFQKAFRKNDRVLSNKNINGVNIYIATEREDLHKMGYIVMNSREFILENPDSLYDDWVGLLNEVS